MKEYYCWRCKMVVPMLEEHEWAEIEPLLTLQVENIKRYRSENSVDLATATEQVMKPATEKYFELTGFHETNYAAIWHHRLEAFGPECKKCGHLFRTPEAKYCANCGQKLHENVSA